MTQFIIGIIIVVLGVILTTVGGYLAKDGWDKMYRKDTNKKSVDIQQLSESNLKDIVTRLAEQLKPQLKQNSLFLRPCWIPRSRNTLTSLVLRRRSFSVS